MPDNELTALLRQAVSAQLVVPESSEQFAFRHALIHDAAYTSVLVRERKRLHRIIAETIERTQTEADGTHDRTLGDLAYHFYAADAWQQALDYAVRAGRRAQSVYAPREAV